MAGDGCGVQCQIQLGYDCPTEGQPCVFPNPSRSCGNGAKNDAEECDDGNVRSNDGCNTNCHLEPAFSCSGSAPNVCTATPNVNICGNGILEPGRGEQCDDGNTLDRDGCGSQCMVEDFYTCLT